MAPNRIMRGRAVRRALLLGVAVALLGATVTACGGSGGSSGSGDQERDARVLNEILGRQLAAVAAYGQALPQLRGAELALARQFRTQEQEHVDAVTKTLRGIGGEADPPAETIEADNLNTRADSLEFLYEMESATLDAELSAVGKLSLDWPRPLIASMATNQAQHLVLLRQALGAGSDEVIPSAFETGELPLPERTDESR
ncbi:MAG TPA: ferritin-like domain-containing protein [Solirubrobacterales bacterium]|nr:ferritin-like domain-containing protein [Solirubrobacterales bacterium]